MLDHKDIFGPLEPYPQAQHIQLVRISEVQAQIVYFPLILQLPEQLRPEDGQVRHPDEWGHRDAGRGRLQHPHQYLVKELLQELPDHVDVGGHVWYCSENITTKKQTNKQTVQLSLYTILGCTV